MLELTFDVIDAEMFLNSQARKSKNINFGKWK